MNKQTLYPWTNKIAGISFNSLKWQNNVLFALYKTMFVRLAINNTVLNVLNFFLSDDENDIQLWKAPCSNYYFILYNSSRKKAMIHVNSQAAAIFKRDSWTELCCLHEHRKSSPELFTKRFNHVTNNHQCIHFTLSNTRYFLATNKLNGLFIAFNSNYIIYSLTPILILRAQHIYVHQRITFWNDSSW